MSPWCCLNHGAHPWAAPVIDLVLCSETDHQLDSRLSSGRLRQGTNPESTAKVLKVEEALKLWSRKGQSKFVASTQWGQLSTEARFKQHLVLHYNMRMQPQIIYYVKIRKYWLFMGKSNPTNAKTQMIQMLEWSEHNIKTSMTEMLQ